MSAVRVVSASLLWPSRPPMAMAMGYIMAAVAVFEIHIDKKAVASMIPSTTRRPPKPMRETMP